MRFIIIKAIGLYPLNFRSVLLDFNTSNISQTILAATCSYAVDVNMPTVVAIYNTAVTLPCI